MFVISSGKLELDLFIFDKYADTILFQMWSSPTEAVE